jgi:EAL domain-containing protein (putative c-di-GMP-specific phosphodiesterase class I)
VSPSEEQNAVIRRRQTERIREVLDGNRFTMLFQPIAELTTGRIVGVEALARFVIEPSRPPQEWFAEAGAVGLRTELELATARAAVKQFARLPAEAYLSLNVSPETVRSPGLLEVLREAPPERLVIEVAEAALKDSEDLADDLKSLRAHGVRLAVDDIAGRGDLLHLLDLAPDIVKLDISLIHHIDSDRIGRTLAEALLSIAAQIGAAVVAEGIETENETKELRRLGVLAGQGFYLALPGLLPAEPSEEPASVPVPDP